MRLRSAEPDQPPSIAPNYLSTGEDREVAADAIRATRRLMKQHALEPYRPQEFLPGPQAQSDSELLEAARDIDVSPDGKEVWFLLDTGDWTHRPGCPCFGEDLNQLMLDSGRRVSLDAEPEDDFDFQAV